MIKPVPTRILVAYALPAFALAALYLPLYTYLTPFYAAERGVDLAAIGVALIAIRIFDAVTDPALGWLSDRTPARLGRRRVWLAASVPVIIVGAWQAFVPPEDAGLAHMVLWLSVLTIGWTMAQTPYTAWGAEIAPDYDQRTRVTGWREAVVLIGTVAVTLTYVAGGTGGEGLVAVAILVVVALPLGVAAAAAVVPDLAPRERTGPRPSLASVFSNGSFRWLLGAWILNGLANGLPVTLFEFFSRDRLGMGAEAFGIMVLLYFASAIIGIPVWLWLARRTSKHRAWCVAMLYACAMFAGALFLGEGDIVAFGAIAVLTGLAFGADLALPPAIQADVIAEDTARTGAARAGIYFALWQVATKASIALSSGMALIALGAAGFVTQGANTTTALVTLSVLYAGVPIVLKLGATAIMWNFRLDRSTVEARA